MALDELLRTVSKEARRQARSILIEARGEARRLVRDAEERIGSELETRLKGSAAKFRRVAARDIAVAHRESRALELAARERFFERVFTAARNQLGSRAVCEALATNFAPRLERLLAYAPEGDVVIHATTATLSAVTAMVGDRKGIEFEADDSSPGALRLEACGGRVLIDDSLERRLETMRPEFRIELAREVPDEP
ncbi:MAG TPA: hypothetical protein VKA53_02415 [Thermoanaerobaculia bacterium]|nr:hypothetical protein [Thermoanaerobaculia bacterium]